MLLSRHSDEVSEYSFVSGSASARARSRSGRSAQRRSRHS